MKNINAQVRIKHMFLKVMKKVKKLKLSHIVIC